MPIVGNATTMHQCRSDKIPFSSSKALQAYSQFMGYKDLVNCDKNCRNFHSQRFQKCLKKDSIGGCIVWNISTDVSEIIRFLWITEGQVYVVTLMLNWVDPLKEIVKFNVKEPLYSLIWWTLQLVCGDDVLYAVQKTAFKWFLEWWSKPCVPGCQIIWYDLTILIPLYIHMYMCWRRLRDSFSTFQNFSDYVV